jgi:hypothetical protein
MKIIVRTFVIALALTGAVASTHVNAAPTTATVRVAKTSALPVPTCDPSVSDCGIGEW